MAADDVTLGVGIEADADSAVRDMRQAATAAAELADSFREIAAVAVRAATAMNKIEKSQSGVATGQKRIADNVSEATKNIQAQAQAATTLASALKSASSSSGPSQNFSQKGFVTSASGETKPNYEYGSYEKELRDISAAREREIKLLSEQQKAEAALERERKRYATVPKAANNVVTADMRDLVATANGARMVGDSFGMMGVSAANARHNVADLRDTLFTARYALYDISNVTTVAGAALIGFNAFAVNAAADYETAMATIQRTTGATTGEIATIRDQFIDLAQSVPAGFENIAKIGELAGQLNIPTERLASFTETVAQFTSTTDVAVQQSAEAFGRLDTLLPDVQGNYEALGSSILNVGVNSVATESQIIATTTQIAAAGAQAGFTADQVIGLAASFASLGVAPEAARGSVIRIFSEISTATTTGGANLEEFARLAGQSADDFRNSWSKSPDTAFLDFLKGLQQEGKNAEATLRAMGITGVRDINALLRLSQNIDIVTQSFGFANVGFSQATQLAEAYGITADTLNSRVQVLGQSFQAFFAEVGEGSTGPLKDFVNVLIDVLRLMTDLAKSPAAQMLAIFGGIFTLLAGGALIITGLVARMGAAGIAIRTVNHELREMAIAAAASGTAMTGLQQRALGAGIALTTFGGIARSVAWASAITAGLTVAVIAFTEIQQSMRSAAEVARDTFGDLSGLGAALAQDTQDVAKGVQTAFAYASSGADDVVVSTEQWTSASERAGYTQTSLRTEIDSTTFALNDNAYAIGENTKAWFAQKLATSEAFQSIVKMNQDLAKAGAPEVDAEGYISAALAGDVTKARGILTSWFAEYKAFAEENGGVALTAFTANSRFAEIETLLTGALEDQAVAAEATRAANVALGVDAVGVAGELDEMASATDAAADRLTALRDAVDTAFATQNSIGQFGADIATLFAGLAEGAGYGADAFNVLSEAGSANLQNLQGAIVSTITAGETMGVSATQSVAALFIELQKRGIDTATLLSQLAGSGVKIPGFNAGAVGQYLNGTKALTGNADQLSKAMGGIANTAPKASRAIGGAGKSAGKAAPQIRTLVDYARDLGGVFDRAFEIQFGATQGLDKIASDFNSMKAEMDDANKTIAETQDKIRDLNQAIAESNAEINSLQVDNSILSYFQQVAEAYGDTLRYADIGSEIAKNDQAIAKERNEIANSNKGIAEEQQKAATAAQVFNKSLVGNSQSAIENREQILGMVENYQALIEQYASAGMDQDSLRAKTEELRAQFMAQATQLGYNQEELKFYASAFDNVRLAIDRVPRNITVAANTSPAMQALNEFIAAASRSEARVNVGSGGGDWNNGYNAGLSYGAGWVAGTSANRRIVTKNNGNVPGGKTYQYYGTNGPISPEFFNKGGYTGNVGTSQPAGIVHGQEYVINARNTARLGRGFFDAINSGKTPVPSGMPGIMVVELSAYDRQLLAQAGNVQLTIPGQAIGGAASAANFVSTKRGTN